MFTLLIFGALILFLTVVVGISVSFLALLEAALNRLPSTPVPRTSDRTLDPLTPVCREVRLNAALQRGKEPLAAQ